MPVPYDTLDRILPRVTKPARYAGGEWNSVARPWAEARVRLLLAFPEVYEIGMSNLGVTVLYDIVNARPGMLAERAFAPWTDMAGEMRRAGIPLYALESRRPAADFDVIGFSLGYELNFSTMLEMLDLARLPLWAGERDDTMPLVIAGGSACYNPEPVAAFLDLIVIGDGEEALPELLEAYARFRQEAGDGVAGSREQRRAFLRQAAGMPGVYVPEFYEARYGEDGRFLALEPVEAAAPASVVPRVVRPLPPPPTRPIVPYLETVHDRAVIEVRRGCGQGCRFCQAGMIYRPVRERPVDEVVEAATAIIASTGYDELGLLSLSTCDYRPIEELLQRLLERFGEDVGISLPSLRVDSFSLHLAEMVQGRRRSGLTFAPEAGTQRLRDAINKKASEANLYEVAEAAFSRKWQRIKLYFMVGLPTETDEDVDGIVEMARHVLGIGRRYHRGRARVAISVST
ncbi:MAG: TIGR03960 family B12-binding radical SAM protein, partial [Anaerolineae bacterium]